MNGPASPNADPEASGPPRIAETVKVEVVSASLNGQASVSLTFRVSGQFERPGSVATLQPTAVVVSVPATIVPT